MKLLRLKLENFRQHQQSEIRFADGMTAIVGANGTGKTTILEAITFALYGKQREDKKTLKFYWAEPRSKLRVTLEFEFDSRTYVLERTDTSAALTDTTVGAGVVKATSLREVTAACERMLRLTYDQFKNSFCAEQKSLTFLQFNTDTRRQEQVAKMLGFDRLKLAAELARERGRSFRAVANALEAQLGNIEELRSQQSLCRDELKHAENAAREMHDLLANLHKQVAAEQGSKNQAEAFARLTQEATVFASNAEALKSARKRAEEAVAAAKVGIENRRKLEPEHKEFLILEKSIVELRALRENDLAREQKIAEIGRLRKDVADLENQISALATPDVAAARKLVQKKIAAHTEAMNAVRAAEAAWSKAQQAAQAELSTAKAEHRQAEQALVKARQLIDKGVCPECGQPTTGDFESKLKCLEAELTATLSELNRCNEVFQALQTKPQAVFAAEDLVDASRAAHELAQNALGEAERISAQLRAWQEQRDAIASRAQLLEAEVAKAASTYDRGVHERAEHQLQMLRPKHDAYMQLGGADDALASAERQLAEAKQEIEAARERYNLLIADRSLLPFKDAADAEAAIRSFEGLQRRVVEAEANVKIAAALVQSAKAKLETAQSRIKTYEDTEASLKTSRGEALLHETADKELKRLREELNAVIRPELESRASDTLSLLTNGRYPVLELDEEFNATLVEDGVSKQVISGGEEDVVALALRMALSELIQERQGRPMSLLILDEVFGSLDTDRRQAVLERLHGIKGRFAQILVISHIEEINQVADQCIFLSRDPKSRATVVGDLPLETSELVLT